MTVRELIKILSEVENKDQHVYYHVEIPRTWLKLPVDEVIKNEDHVILGDNLPFELHEIDYKY